MRFRRSRPRRTPLSFSRNWKPRVFWPAALCNEMTIYHRTLLFVRVCWELLRCELVLSVGGFPGIYKGLNRKIRTTGHPGCREVWESAICQAVDIVNSCYWKRILCLERSVITARVMHAYGIGAEVVIGY